MTVRSEAGPCTYEHSFDFAAPRRRVFEALTREPDLRQWFAEHVHIQPRVGGMYRFWGRHTAWMASEADADQVITAFEPAARLAFRWTWRDTPCDADLRLEDAGDATCRVHVRMTAGERRMGFGGDCAWYMSDFWRLSMGNLRAYLASGHAALRPDYWAKGDGVDMSIFIAAPPDVVFSALVEPEKMDRWISAKAISSAAAGSEFSFGWTIKHDGDQTPCGPTTLLEVVPNRLVVHDWQHRNEPETRVCWRLSEAPGGTIVRLVHERRIVEPEFGGYVGGWTAFMLELREFATALAEGTDSQWRSPSHAGAGSTAATSQTAAV